MTDTSTATVPAHVQLIQMCAGSWVAAAVHATAKLRLVDHLADGPRTDAMIGFHGSEPRRRHTSHD